MKMKTNLAIALGSTLLVLGSQAAHAACSDVPRTELVAAVTATEAHEMGGYGLNMWVTMVDESGKVCHVTTSGTSGAKAGNSAWLGSRVISAQKANTANAFSLDGYAISTANLYSAVQPGGSLFGLQFSNPVDPSVAYQGAASQFGTASDPLRNKRVGGINVFGGGLALYKAGKKVGAIGVSGDTSCRDHAFSWHVREHLVMEPAGDPTTSTPTGTVGITNYNMNADGDPQTSLAVLNGLTGPNDLKGDEMIILNSNATDATDYWNAWAQPACPNSTGASTAELGTLIIPSNP